MKLEIISTINKFCLFVSYRIIVTTADALERILSIRNMIRTAVHYFYNETHTASDAVAQDLFVDAFYHTIMIRGLQEKGDRLLSLEAFA